MPLNWFLVYDSTKITEIKELRKINNHLEQFFFQSGIVTFRIYDLSCMIDLQYRGPDKYKTIRNNNILSNPK